MLLFILLSIWIFMLLILGLRPDVDLIVESWPYNSQSKIANNNAKICKGLYWITFVFIWGLTAFRSANIGNDTVTYLYYFDIFSSGGIDKSRTFELGYQFLNVFIGKFTNDPHIFIIIMATIMYVGTAGYIMKYSKNCLVSLCLFFCYFFTFYTSAYRQVIAMIIVLFAYQGIKENKYLKAIILIAFAFLFHSTAIIALLLFLRSSILIDRKKVLILVVLGLIISQTEVLNRIIAIVLPRYSHYFVSQYSGTGWVAISYELIINLTLFVLVSKAVNRNKLDYRLCLTNFALLLIFSSFGYSMNLFTRASKYFLLVATVELPNVFYENQLPSRRTWLFGICIVSIVMFILVLIYRPDWNHIYPYEIWK